MVTLAMASRPPRPPFLSSPLPPPAAAGGARLSSAPLRSQLYPRHQPASPHLLHLQRVATWASRAVPPLGAFLGSRLAATCESLGCPPPPSPHFSCERCESILQVGINCSVQVGEKKVQKPFRKGRLIGVNSTAYSCHYCLHVNWKPGVFKTNKKTKLSEVASQSCRSEVGQGLNSFPSESLQVTRVLDSEQPLNSRGSSSEGPMNTAKKAKRKGWKLLKELATTTTVFSASPSLKGKPVPVQRLSKPLLPVVEICGTEDALIIPKMLDNCEHDEMAMPLVMHTGVLHSSSHKEPKWSPEMMLNKTMPDVTSVHSTMNPCDGKRGESGLHQKMGCKRLKGMSMIQKSPEVPKYAPEQSKRGALGIRKVGILRKKRPMFRRFGRHWFTVCNQRRKCNLRIV